MTKRISKLNGRLENEVQDFVDMLAAEFGFLITRIDLFYYDDQEDEDVYHVFNYNEYESNYVEEK